MNELFPQPHSPQGRNDHGITYGLQGMSGEQRAFYAQPHSVHSRPEDAALGHFDDNHVTFLKEPEQPEAYRQAPEQHTQPSRLRAKAARFLGKIVPRRLSKRFITGENQDAIVAPTDAPELTPSFPEADRFAFEAQSFKGESVQTFKRAPNFNEVLQTAKERTTLLTSRRLIAEPNGTLSREEGDREEAEGEAAIELDTFLQQAMNTLWREKEASSMHVKPAYTANEVAHFRENLTFIGEPELHEAVEGFAAYWESILKSDRTAKIALYQPNIAKHGDVQKSSEFIGDHIFEALKRRTQTDPMLRSRIRRFQDTNPQTFIDDNTKIIIAEDWIASGATIRNNVQELTRTLAGMGKTEALKNLEVNLIVAREDQVAEGISTASAARQPHNVPTLAYYESPASSIYGGPLPTGAHSTEDYGFGQVLQGIGEDVARIKRQPVPLPLLADVTPSYRKEY